MHGPNGNGVMALQAARTMTLAVRPLRDTWDVTGKVQTIGEGCFYAGAMDTPAKSRVPSLQDLIDVLARSEADIAAGRVYELEDVLRDFDNDIAELEKGEKPLAER